MDRESTLTDLFDGDLMDCIEPEIIRADEVGTFRLPRSKETTLEFTSFLNSNKDALLTIKAQNIIISLGRGAIYMGLPSTSVGEDKLHYMERYSSKYYFVSLLDYLENDVHVLELLKEKNKETKEVNVTRNGVTKTVTKSIGRTKLNLRRRRLKFRSDSERKIQELVGLGGFTGLNRLELLDEMYKLYVGTYNYDKSIIESAVLKDLIVKRDDNTLVERYKKITSQLDPSNSLKVTSFILRALN